jgi:hypothetical protein
MKTYPGRMDIVINALHCRIEYLKKLQKMYISSWKLFLKLKYREEKKRMNPSFKEFVIEHVSSTIATPTNVQINPRQASKTAIPGVHH